MKKLFLPLLLPALAIVNIAIAQDSFPVNDLPGAELSSGTTVKSPAAMRDFSPTNCNDLSQNISINLGLASPAPGSTERVGIQFGRIFRDGIPSICPSKAYPGIFNAQVPYGYHAIQFSNCSPVPVCITVNVYTNDGSLPCGTNAHANVYQSADGLDPAPYNPASQGANYLGDIGSSLSQPFSVTVNPGFFEVVFTNTATVSQCEVSFNITVFPEYEGAINCQCNQIPVSNWALILVAIAIVMFTTIRFRRILP